MKKSAFTIIELLVVVSIIALLIALILPSLGKAKMESKKVVCGNNLHALGIGMQLYFSEFNQKVPINGILFPKSGVPAMYKQAGADPRFAAAEVTDTQKWRLEYGGIWNEMGGNDISQLTPPLPWESKSVQARKFLCPQDVENNMARLNSNTSAGKAPLRLEKQADGTSLVQLGKGDGGYWSYSVNAVLNSLGRLRDNTKLFPPDANGKTSLPWQDPLTQNGIRSASDFIFFVEEDQESLFNDEVFEPAAARSPLDTERITNRHNGGGNVGFADGHVEAFNELLFDNPNITNPITRLFFPDGGEFLGSLP